MSDNREIFPQKKQISSYKIIKMIGRGSYGDVYLVTDARNLKNYAMKTESINAEKQTLSYEVDLLYGTNVAYFPSIRGHGEEAECRYYVMDVLGPPLSKVIHKIQKNNRQKIKTTNNNENIQSNNIQLINNEKNRINSNSNLLNSSPEYLSVSLKTEEINSTKTINSNSSVSSNFSLSEPTYSTIIDPQTFYTIAEETLKILEYLHTQLGIVHRDVKPSNFLLRPRSNAPLCLVDFGLAKRYIDKTTHRPIPASTKKRFTGTIRYASPNAHEGLDLAPRDDLYSWFYMMLEIKRNGKLPWDKINDRKESLEIKKKIYIYDNCSELPEKFASIYRTISGLTYESMPNYALLFSMLKSAKESEKVEMKPKTKKKRKTKSNLAINLDDLDNDTSNYDDVWVRLMNVIPESLEIVPNETEQLKADFIVNESERLNIASSAYGLESPLISDEDQCSDGEKNSICPCTIF